jgi:hypothetical protein
VLVAGVSGAGKTTFAGRLAALAGLPHTEIDALFHGPDWTPRPEFQDDVRALVAQPEWVTEWQYGEVRPLLAAHADLLVWLDHPFWRVTFPRVVRRTVRRRLLREELWNGNREGSLAGVLMDQEHIIRWAVRTRRKYRDLVQRAARKNPGLVIVRLGTPAEAEAWLTGSFREAVRL